MGDQTSIPVLKDAKHLVPGPEFGQFGVQTIIVAAHQFFISKALGSPDEGGSRKSRRRGLIDNRQDVRR